MNARVDTAELRQRLADPVEVCAMLGLLDGAKRQARGLLVRCPSHGERNPSCSVRVASDGTIAVRCFACGFTGSVFDLVGAVRGLDPKRDFHQVKAEAAELVGMTLDDDRQRHQERARRPRAPRPAPEPRPEPKPTDEALTALCGVLATVGRLDHDPFATDACSYLESRHLLAEARAAEWFALPPVPQQTGLMAWLATLADTAGADVAREHAPGWTREDLEVLGWLPRIPQPHNRLCIPWRDPSGRVTTVQRRRLDGGKPKYYFPDGRGAAWPFGIERLRDGAPVAIVEGAGDTLAYRTLCRMHGIDRDVIGLPGTQGWQPQWAELLRGREVIVALDADDAGERAAVKLAEVARQAGARSVRRVVPNGPGDWADQWAASRGAR